MQKLAQATRQSVDGGGELCHQRKPGLLMAQGIDAQFKETPIDGMELPVVLGTQRISRSDFIGVKYDMPRPLWTGWVKLHLLLQECPEAVTLNDSCMQGCKRARYRYVPCRPLIGHTLNALQYGAIRTLCSGH